MRRHAFANIALTDNVVRFATRALLRQSAHRAGTGGGTGGDRRRRVRRPAAAGGLPRGAAVSAAGSAERATAFAPASVGNVAIGFDILGFSVDALGDRVTVSVRDTPGVRDPRHRAAWRASCRARPRDNTAGRALLALLEALRPGFGFEHRDRQGHSAGIGPRRLGGLRGRPRWWRPMRCCRSRAAPLELLKFAMQGEAVASGSAHVDNIAASLFGGLVLTVGIDHPRVKQIPVPPAIRAVIVHPHMFLVDRARRAPSSSAASSCRTSSGRPPISPASSPAATPNDLDMIRDSFEDVVIEPQRAALIPGFHDVRRARDGGRRARLLDLRRRADDVRLVRTATRTGGARGHAARVRAPVAGRPTTGSSRSAHRRAGDRTERAVRQHARPRRAGGFRRGAAPGPGTRRRPVRARSSWPQLTPRQFGDRSALARSRRAAARALASQAMRSRRACRRSPPRRSTFQRRSCRSMPTGGLACSSCSTARPRRSRISARASSRPASPRLPRAAAGRITILVATSGDTGGAVAAAFHRRPGIEVAVLFPKGLVSPHPGAAAHLLGRQRPFAARARHVR